MTRPWLRALAAIAGVLLGIGLVSGFAAGLSLTSQSFTPYRTCTITATPATTTAVADTTAQQGNANANNNFGSISPVTLSSFNNANQRIYVRFDLTTCNPAIPASATVRLATLRLYMISAPTACRVLDLFPATVAWGETTLTWNNQPFGTTLNNPATGSRTGTFSVGPMGCQNQSTGTYVTGATVTSDVAKFVAGTATNFGWMIRDDTEGTTPAQTATFSAKELGTVALEPQLVITYVTAP